MLVFRIGLPQHYFTYKIPKQSQYLWISQVWGTPKMGKSLVIEHKAGGWGEKKGDR